MPARWLLTLASARVANLDRVRLLGYSVVQLFGGFVYWATGDFVLGLASVLLTPKAGVDEVESASMLFV